MFNNKERISLEEIAAALKMDPKELRKYMKSLALQKEKILLKEPEGKDINSGDVFRVRRVHDGTPLSMGLAGQLRLFTHEESCFNPTGGDANR